MVTTHRNNFFTLFYTFLKLQFDILKGMKVKHILIAISIGTILFAAYHKDVGTAGIGCLCLLGSTAWKG